MSSIAMFISASILLPALGVVALAWFAMVEGEEDLRSLSGFEAMHFEIERQAADQSRPARS